ncbi:hexokinase-domain-containing protein [Cunninghamella echinulata]|nr:hexokinase-domain-containing protein [Cunninghamella echinulata]
MEDIEAMFQVSNEKLDILIKGFSDEMKAGLSNDYNNEQVKRNLLKMIPSYVTGHPTGNEKGTYLALEISGVDIYVCQVKLKGDGGKLAINQYQYKIPDYFTAGDDIGVLIDYVAGCVADFQTRVGISNNSNERTYSMAISVGFAVRQTGLDCGVIIALEHGFEFPNAIGCNIVDLFHQKFHEKGLAIKIVAIANDAVCTLLAHAYQHPSTRIGIVHAAGTNCAYYDKISNMSAFLSQQENANINLNQEMIINTEWCNFGSKQYLPMTIFDHILDNESNNQGIHIFEKMTTGMYLGEQVRQILIHLLDQGILSFSTTTTTTTNDNNNNNNNNNNSNSNNSNNNNNNENEDAEDCLLRVPYQFDTSYMYVCEADEDLDTLEDTRVVLEEMCKVGPTTLADREIVKKACELVGNRAAILLGASIASVVKYMFEHKIGIDQPNGFAICK